MLWWKAWCESRARFLLSAGALAVISATFVFMHRDVSTGISDEPMTYSVYIWKITYRGYLRELFMILTLMLGLGGLTRERDHRTAGYTLALPVGRGRLVAARAVMGLLQTFALAAIPAIVIPALSPLVGRAYPSLQGWEFALLWAGGGALVFAIAFIASVLFGGELTAPVAAFFGLVAYSLIADLPVVARYLTDIHDLMSGSDMPYFVKSSATIIGPMPWTSLAALMMAVVGIVVIAGRISQRQDF
ncbi:MAG: hypothetical protein ABI969_15280 [bacterium]